MNMLNPQAVRSKKLKSSSHRRDRRRLLTDLGHLLNIRLAAVKSIVLDAVEAHLPSVENIINLLGTWMVGRETVRVVGAGRALLAASLPSNRLAHGGANVWILGDKSPLPNSRLGGAVIAVSASGKTQSVLEIMRAVQAANKEHVVTGNRQLVTVGISDAKATEFESLCSPECFIGIRPDRYRGDVTLRALGDIEEYSISELLDALVVAAGLRVGANFRLGHEDLGPVRPLAPTAIGFSARPDVKFWSMQLNKRATRLAPELAFEVSLF